MKDLEPIDVIALLVIGGGLILTAYGINHTVSGILIMVVSYYFGKKSSGILRLEDGHPDYTIKSEKS